MPNPLFLSTSSEKPKLLTISFEKDPQGSLGAQLVNADKVRIPVDLPLFVLRVLAYTECQNLLSHYYENYWYSLFIFSSRANP